jgi:hypothetical protein
MNGPIGSVTLERPAGYQWKLRALALVGYAAFFCCTLTFAHLARWNAAIFFRAAADRVRRGSALSAGP